MAMEIENYEGSADNFTWTYNPKVFDDGWNGNYESVPIRYTRRKIIVSGGGIASRSVVLTGHFSGASKRTYYQNMSKHFMDSHLLKKLYFQSDKFLLGVGSGCKETDDGARQNFIDYVASFDAVCGILFGDTQKTSGTNAGNVTTFVESITGTVTDGASDVVLSDGTTTITINSSAVSTNDAIVYSFVKMVSASGGIYTSEYAYVSVNGTQTKKVKITGGTGVLELAAGANITTVTTSNLTNPVKTFRDGWSA